jgi:hypothetical protein
MIIKLTRKIEIHEMQEEDFPGQKDEYRRQQVVEAAVAVVRDVLEEGFDGTEEEGDYLISAVVVKLLEVIHMHDGHRLAWRSLKARALPKV